MNVGIIVFSQTGNTLAVAEKLEAAIKSQGHTASIERIEGISEGTCVSLTSTPRVEPYDAIIFASPVQAFTLALVMKQYLSQIPDLSDKTVYCFVTQQLKKAWLGGNRAVRKITDACKVRGVDVKKSGIVHWSSKARENQINDIVNRLSSF